MPRYVAFLRGVTPQNAKMADLKRCLEEAGYADVRTILSSGNVAFNATGAVPAAIEHHIEQSVEAALGRFFGTTVRTAEHLQQLVTLDPFADDDVAPDAKRVITFLRRPVSAAPDLPIERDGVRILRLRGQEVFTAYVPNAKGPVFMTLLERTFGKDITTRTLDTVRKCAFARES